MLNFITEIPSVLEAVPDALVIINRKGEIIYTNAQTEKIFGYTANELLGKNIEILIPQRYHAHHTTYRDKYFNFPQVRPMGIGLELYGLKKNGTEFSVEISLNTLKTDEEMLALAAIRDITERKKTEAEFKGILEATPDALIMINSQGRIVLANAQAEQLFNYTRNELLTMTVEQLIPERFRAKHQQYRLGYFNNVRVRPMGKGIDLYGLKKNQEEFSIEISLSPLEINKETWALAAIRDATERRHLQQSLQEKNIKLQKAIEELQLQTNERLIIEKELAEQSMRVKMTQEYRAKQEEFINTICHEIRNPLNGICGATVLMRDKIAAIEEKVAKIQEKPDMELSRAVQEMLSQVKEDLNILEQCSRQEKFIVDDVLDLSKLENDKIELNASPFKLKETLNNLIRMVHPQLQQKKLNLSVNFPEEDLWLIADVHRLSQIMMNLLTNAIKFTKEKGQIFIHASCKVITETDLRLSVTVKDTGIGITPQEISKLFTPFSQANRHISSEYGGSGLGLVICKKLVEKMGGTIDVESQKNRGSQFTFTILCQAMTKKQQLQAISEGNIEQATLSETEKRTADKTLNIDSETLPKQKHILIVEDNFINQNILKRFLTVKNYAYQIANNGQEALQKCQEFEFDLVFMDIEMPVMGGVEATRKIREMQENPNYKIPIIGLSGNARKEQIEMGKKSGMNDYLTKPFHREEIYQVIEKYTSTPFSFFKKRKSEMIETKAESDIKLNLPS